MNWFQRNFKTIIYCSFLVPILTVAFVSISHVTKWYGISNPLTWAIYLSIGVEIAALSALAAISADMGKKVYFPFGIVTLVQFIGNIYFAYSYIDVTSQAFTSWVELVSPLLEYLGVEPTDMVGHKRFLAFFAGGMLPIISLSFLHMLVKFTQSDKSSVTPETPVSKTAMMVELSPVVMSQACGKFIDCKSAARFVIAVVYPGSFGSFITGLATSKNAVFTSGLDFKVVNAANASAWFLNSYAELKNDLLPAPR